MSCYDCEDCGPDYVCRYCQPMIVAADPASSGDSLASSTGSEKRRGRCLCDLCTRISPMYSRLQEALPEPMRADFEYLMMRLMCAEEDRDVADMKLTGEWPGWEWMKAAREKEEAASPNGEKIRDAAESGTPATPKGN